MVLLRYFATLLPALAAFGALEVVFATPRWTLQVFGAWLLVLLGTHLFLRRGQGRAFAVWEFLIPPAMLFLSAGAFALFLEAPALRHLVAVFVAALALLIEWNLYLFLYQPMRYQANALEHLSLLANLAAVFFGVTSIFGLRVFVGFAAWKLLLSVLLGSALVLHQSFWVTKLPFRATVPYLALIPALLTQLTVALVLLPVTHLVQGTVFTIAYYALFGIARSVLVGNYGRRLARRYAAVSLLSSLSVLVSAKWT